MFFLGQRVLGYNEQMETKRAILFFDGVCNLCNTFVDFVIWRDHQRKFYFAPLQGQTAKQLLDPAYIEDLDTFVLWVDDTPHTKSTGALKVLYGLGGAWRVFGLFLFLPRLIRDPVYELIARHRYRLFGRKASCRLPRPEEQAHFLQ